MAVYCHPLTLSPASIPLRASPFASPKMLHRVKGELQKQRGEKKSIPQGVATGAAVQKGSPRLYDELQKIDCALFPAARLAALMT